MDKVLVKLAQLEARGEEAVLVTVVEREGSSPGVPGAKMLVTSEGLPVGTVGGGALERHAIVRARELLTERRTQLVRYALGQHEELVEGDEPTGMICGGRAALFFDYLGYAAHVYILGGGHVGRAIARHLAGMGLYVTVVDHRPEVAEGLVGANRVLIGDYAALLAAEDVPEGSYFVIVTAGHAYDYDALRQVMVADHHPRYVGMIGSRAKATELTRRLADELGAEKVDWSVLYCPVGLDTGGPSPDEIAISIIGEMQVLRYAKAGHKHMRLAWPPH